MTPARIDLDVVLATERVDRAVAAGDRAQPGLLRRAATSRSASRRPRDSSPPPPPGAADRRRTPTSGSASAATSRRNASGAQVAFASEKATTSPRRPPHGAVLCRDLAPAGAVEQPHAAVTGRRLLDERVRPVCRGVGGDDDLELVRRVVELEQVLQPSLDHRFLVVRRDDDAHRRLGLAVAPHRPRAQAGRRSGGERVGDMGPRQRSQRAPEERLQQQHGASVRGEIVASAPSRLTARISPRERRAGLADASPRRGAIAATVLVGLLGHLALALRSLPRLGVALAVTFAAVGLAGLVYSTTLSYSGTRFPERYAGGRLAATYRLAWGLGRPGDSTQADQRALWALRRYDPDRPGSRERRTSREGAARDRPP